MVLRKFCSLLVILLVGTGTLPELSAQIERSVTKTYSFAIVKKTPAHPFYGMGHDMGYSVDGVEGDTLFLVRDSTYGIYFDTLTPTEFPYAYTDPSGGFLNRYKRITIGDFLAKKYIYWRADEETPDVLYYGNVDYLFMGGTIIVVDSLTTSVREARDSRHKSRVASYMAPNPVREAGVLSFAPRNSGRIQIQIVDALGRIVSESGHVVTENTEATIPIDRGDLTTGIYFYRVIDSRLGNDVITSGSFHVQ